MHHGQEEFNHRNAQVVHTTIKYECYIPLSTNQRRKSLMIILTEAERTLSKIKLSFY